MDPVQLSLLGLSLLERKQLFLYNYTQYYLKFAAAISAVQEKCFAATAVMYVQILIFYRPKHQMSMLDLGLAHLGKKWELGHRI